MTIQVDISDRLYDYTDEEKVAEALEVFQAESGLSDDEVLAIWLDESCPQRPSLEKLIFDAVDSNGTVKRAREHVPTGVELSRAPA